MTIKLAFLKAGKWPDFTKKNSLLSFIFTEAGRFSEVTKNLNKVQRNSYD